MPTIVTELSRKHCTPCEGDCPAIVANQLHAFLEAVPSWKFVAEGKRIRKEWRVKDFKTALDFFRRIGDVAESEGHHPDLHLVGYRNVAIEIWTHAAKGLTENDFILAAKIDEIPVELRQ
jgi:4a-hydroxytetrahydrobiopterin dehydratase